MHAVNVAIIRLGNVGSGTLAILSENAGKQISLQAVLQLPNGDPRDLPVGITVEPSFAMPMEKSL